MAAVAAAALHPLVLESGPERSLRDPASPSDLVRGVGGAGLFSDGKFSFRPSASKLWKLQSDLLRAAECELTQLTKSFGIRVPVRVQNQSPLRTIGSHRVKSYPSEYMPLARRSALIDSLRSRIPRLLTNSSVGSVAAVGSRWLVRLHDGSLITSLGILIASGRFGPLLLEPIESPRLLRPVRLEVGIRIQQPSGEFFLRSHEQLDPKLIWRNDLTGDEWRTFCCCRDGIVVETEFNRVRSFSGRADCPPTGRSNVGFNIRMRDPTEIRRHWTTVRNLLSMQAEPLTTTLGSLIGSPKSAAPLRAYFGPEISARLIAGIRLLMRDFPRDHLERAEVFAPTIEGVGLYPSHDNALRVADNVWIAGDTAGDFRGLVAALVSGHIAGSAAAKKLGVLR